jgi:hypothetical protein
MRKRVQQIGCCRNALFAGKKKPAVDSGLQSIFFEENRGDRTIIAASQY